LRGLLSKLWRSITLQVSNLREKSLLERRRKEVLA
jgi:hypothetical protein